ncbi:MAG TPA: imidazoleglycerol-phosphate dehydratase HisB [Spirochaetota bacterium]|nr:imidazoleglycerol-phosphate dehydratase HisB [Spirochaetota bacterium]HPI89489.1 imidazoleglycerol-phosphate dehydratase HisB [Spirochaetota bacterium]HPR49562.1 imidazoleglycerol-phosphate dehydratase HisB [Spirochaetota bacterium]
MSRQGDFNRKTRETDIVITVTLDSMAESKIDTGVPFFDHMLLTMARHGRFCLNVSCLGDTHVDDHHTVEDIGISMGQAVKAALGNRAGITRFGNALVPMDDALAMAAVDLSGRSYFSYTGEQLRGYIARYSEELTLEFFRSFADNAGLNLHLNLLNGTNRHHIHEALFKAVSRALYQAMSIDRSLDGAIPSEKGTIS